MMELELTAQGAGAARVMLVDDSAVVRGLMRRWIDGHPTLSVAATSANGAEAIEQARRVQPDLIVLDVEMPVMDGLTALPQLIQAAPKAKVLIASTLSTCNAKISLKAMSLGATDYVAKPGSGSITRSEFEQDLLAKLVALAPVPVSSTPLAKPATPNNLTQHPQGITGLALVASTGGPAVLSELMLHVRPFARHLSLFVVQHMPAHFTPLLGKDLCALSQFEGGEAQQDQPVKAGHLYVAPGDYHMRLRKRAPGLCISLDQGPPEHFCRPAADPFLKSFAAHYGAQGAVFVLTGMGQDGAEGALAVRQAGGVVVAQDQSSSAVWGMPGAAVAVGSAQHEVKLADMGAALHSLLQQAPAERARPHA
ncbi:chemotaxis-specific protein-glutamate methyltransferase CheB [Maritalea mediterranea]|uniref:protein-glutamate methylesterase n=1 Tax=Maritalea mediterranea TaxID=2909667 RepID=A0ABS9EE89_9HYPH|nr:chemotaxis-specific protein-glutamate methyltransferase CheB [Maritalea mediterranea]MCF4099723.1 chemotaxis-specific protein-glutamate methyltransferase CheB [Maritalea mediterranea]